MSSYHERDVYTDIPGFDVEALSGILGSVSIACWVFVFSPQIIENFRRSSAEGLSIVFIVVWLLGDLFNIVGAILQGVLPTMIILAVYYTLADIVLMIQCFYYRGFTLSDAPQLPKDSDEWAIMDGNEQEHGSDGHGQQGNEQAVEDEVTPLLSRTDSPVQAVPPQLPLPSDIEGIRRRSSASFADHVRAVDGTHLNPAVPLINPNRVESPAVEERKSKTSPIWKALFNIAALVVVCLAGVVGWWLSTAASRSPFQRHDDSPVRPPNDEQHRHGDPKVELPFDPWGQIFGYLCAILYLGSRVPQLLLNHRRKSTEGVSMLFFLFACVGNLTYVLSIFAYEPPCARWNPAVNYHIHQPIGYSEYCRDGEWKAQYGRYIAVNLSWLIGSAGTLLLDAAVFVQFWMYRGRAPNEGTIQIHTVPNSPVDARHQAELDRE